MAGQGLTILHVSADYPDPLMPRKTRAIANLLALVPEHTHCVYSLNRVGWRAGIQALDFADDAGEVHRAVAYGGPPKGLFLKRYLDRLADWLAEDLFRRGVRPDLVHAHKLSIEGLIGASTAKRLGVPLAISIQGDTDLKIIGARRDLVPLWQKIWQGAAVVFPFAPWASERLTEWLGPRAGPVFLLPCPSQADGVLRPQITGPIFRSAFHMAMYRRKNAVGLLRAVVLAARRVPEIRLEIMGGGDAAAFAHLAACVERIAPGRVRFLGAVPNTHIQALFNGSCAFALPSHRESFGMVFAEALLAGCPCLIPRGWGIDGYFADGEALLAVRSRDVSEIAEGLVRLAREESSFKARLARLADDGALDRLRRTEITKVYRSALAEAVPDYHAVRRARSHHPDHGR
jgi:glycosyltransferase involved in cell wall biosynthesis